MNVLIIEDDKDISIVLLEFLEKKMYNVEAVFDGISALDKIESNNYDIILLDIMLPNIDGDIILKKIRDKLNIPIIVISALDLANTKVKMLNLGADDYIIKPFNLDEVFARIERLLKLYNNTKNEMKYKDISIDLESKRVFIDEKEIDFTFKEYEILLLFIENQNKVFSKYSICDSIWNGDYSEENTVKVHISNLRKKLKKYGKYDEYIETVWGMGYRLNL